MANITELLKILITFNEKCKNAHLCFRPLSVALFFFFFPVVSDIVKLSKYYVDFMAARDLQNVQ